MSQDEQEKSGGAWDFTGKLLDGRYLIESQLGRGGIGVVYLARDTKLMEKRVVVKVLLDQLGDECCVPIAQAQAAADGLRLDRALLRVAEEMRVAASVDGLRFRLRDVVQERAGEEKADHSDVLHQCRRSGARGLAENNGAQRQGEDVETALQMGEADPEDRQGDEGSAARVAAVETDKPSCARALAAASSVRSCFSHRSASASFPSLR